MLARLRHVQFMLALVFFAHGLPAQPEPLPIDRYRQLVAEVYAAAQRSDRIGLDDRAATLLELSEVILPDGTRISVDNGWLRDALAEEPPAFRDIEARLGAILDALGQPRAAQPSDALQRLEQVYEGPPFKSREVPSAWTSFWRAVGRAINDFFDRLFSNLPQAPAAPRAPAQSFSRLSPTGWVLLALGLVLVIGLVVYAFRGVRRSIVAEARVREEAAQDEPQTAEDAFDQAQAAARSGDYRTAARHLYLSSLLWLEDRKLLRYDRSRTNREYLTQLRGKPVHDELAPVVETFERVWYGHRALDAEEFERYQRQVQSLRTPRDQSR